MAQLGMDSKQVENWFRWRRKVEVKAAALKAGEARRAATTWPHYKLSNAKQVQEVCEVEKVMGVSADSGKDLLKELEERMKEVERRAVDTVVIRPAPLLNVTLSQQEVMYREHSPLLNCLKSHLRASPSVSISISSVLTIFSSVTH